jgi:hypothetical protein
MAGIGTIVGFIAAEVVFQSVTIATGYKIFKFIPRIIRITNNLSRNVVRRSDSKQIIFYDICDTVDLINY